MTWSCERMQRLWLESQDGGGWLARFILTRHLADCAACRSFAADADSLLRGPAVVPGVPPRITEALHARARERLALGAFPEAETGRAMPAPAPVLAAAAAALVFVIVAPPVRLGGRTPAPRIGSEDIDRGIAAVETGFPLDQTPSLDEVAGVTLEDRIDDIQESIECLRSQVDESIWNSYQGGDPCTGS